MNFMLKKSEKTLVLVLLLAMAAVWLVPVVSVVKQSLVFNGFKNYILVFTSTINGTTIWRTFLNSTLIGLICIISVLCISSVAGFAFAKMRLHFKNTLFYIMLVCLAVPANALFVPLFFTMKNFALYNSYWAIIIPEVAMTLPFTVLFFKTHFDGLSNELMESGFIDGANIYRIFWHIYAPLAKPVFLTVGILTFLWSYNDFFFPLTMTTSRELQTATLAVYSFKGSLQVTSENIGMYNAALVILALPTVLLYAFGQKFIYGQLTEGSVKG